MEKYRVLRKGTTTISKMCKRTPRVTCVNKDNLCSQKMPRTEFYTKNIDKMSSFFREEEELPSQSQLLSSGCSWLFHAADEEISGKEEMHNRKRRESRFFHELPPMEARRWQLRTKKKFIRLRDEWRLQRGHEPSTMKVVMLPAYQKIIGMGFEVVPFLLRELDKNIDNWFWALMAITEDDPVTEEARGDGEAMAQAWLNWARERGIEW